jgi:pimeloyl-ACP methyl ester carboxylesterase
MAKADRITHGRLAVSGLRTPPGRIELPYAHYRRGEARPTVFFLGGGPGVSNLKFVPPPEWLRDFDVVVLEYRGVGKSSIVLESKHFTRGLRQPLHGLSRRAAERMQPAFAAGFAELKSRHVDFEEFSVSALADDIERLRQQLGLDHVYLVAHSFGTRVALQYQTRYREQTAGAVLFAMNTPGGFIWYPADTESVWRRYRESGRLLGPHSRPKRFGFLEIEDGRALMTAFFLSFNAPTRDRAFKAMSSSARWYLLALSGDLVVRYGFNWADFFVKGYTSDCDRAAVAKADEQGSKALFQSPSAVFFSAIDGFEAAGGRCPSPPFEPDYRRTLAITGEFDPSTPIERKPGALPDHRFIVVKDAGHADVLYGDPAATAAWLTRFFLQGGSSS